MRSIFTKSITLKTRIHCHDGYLVSSQHFDVLHASCLGNISLSGEDARLHATHVLSVGGDGLPREVAVVHDALPRVIALSVFFDERIVLFFFDDVIGAALSDLAVALIFPLVEFYRGLFPAG